MILSQKTQQIYGNIKSNSPKFIMKKKKKKKKTERDTSLSAGAEDQQLRGL
jgi:hypothetical protein